MEYLSLSNDEYFSVSAGVSVSPKEETYWGDETAYVVPVDLTQNDGVAGVTETKKSLSMLGLEKVRNKVNPINTILLLRSGFRIPRIGILKIPAVISNSFLAVKIKDENQFLPEYVALMLDSSKKQISHFSIGNTMLHLKRDIALSMQIPLIPLEEQKKILS
jgi:restriction endonuclease S subunit